MRMGNLCFLRYDGPDIDGLSPVRVLNAGLSPLERPFII